MEREIIKEEIRAILIPILEHENINLDDQTKTVDIEGWNSLSHILIITEIEKKFGIKFKLRELNKMDNIGAIVDAITIKIQAQI